MSLNNSLPILKTNMSTSNSKYKNIKTLLSKSLVLMLIHKDEIYKGDLRNFLSLINITEGLHTYFWIKKLPEQSPKIKMWRVVIYGYSRYI